MPRGRLTQKFEENIEFDREQSGNSVRMDRVLIEHRPGSFSSLPRHAALIHKCTRAGLKVGWFACTLGIGYERRL